MIDRPRFDPSDIEAVETAEHEAETRPPSPHERTPADRTDTAAHDEGCTSQMVEHGHGDVTWSGVETD